MASPEESLPGNRLAMINGAKEQPTHMAIDSVTFNSIVKIMSKLPWDEVNIIMPQLMVASPVTLKNQKELQPA